MMDWLCKRKLQRSKSWPRTNPGIYLASLSPSNLSGIYTYSIKEGAVSTMP